MKIFNYRCNEEKYLSKAFISDGYIIRSVSNYESLNTIRDEIINHYFSITNNTSSSSNEDILNLFHDYVSIDQLNDVRLSIFRHINSLEWFRPTYFAIASDLINKLVGSELAMQKQINLSIQLPKDKTSIVGMHADSYSGESVFQVNQWLPLVDCSGTKSMYILPPEINKEVVSKMSSYEKKGTKEIFKDYKNSFKWIDIKYGQVMIFNSGLLHGNVVNNTGETRFSLNTRYKGLFTPYTENGKGLGSFYTPITLKAATRIGLNNEEPKTK